MNFQKTSTATQFFLASLASTLILAGCGSRSVSQGEKLNPAPESQSQNDFDVPKKERNTDVGSHSLRFLSATEMDAIKPIEQKTGRFAECGVESYSERRDVLCGVESYHLRSSSACDAIIKEDPRFGALEFRSGEGEACGVAEYFSQPDEACGVDKEEFWSDWDEGCPAGYAEGSLFTALSNTETRIHRLSWTDIRVQTRHRCLRSTPKTCALPQFGVKKFKSCRNVAFGVERYKSGTVGYETCRSEAHGVESYNACRHETFGVEKYKSCSLYMTQPELDGYLRAQSDLLPALSSTVLDSAAIFYSSAGKTKALACLVKEIVENPKQRALAEDIKRRYFILTDRFWSEAEVQECSRGFIEIDNAYCSEDDVAITCTAWRSFRKAHKGMLTSRKNLTLLSQEVRERGHAAVAQAISDLVKAAQ